MPGMPIIRAGDVTPTGGVPPLGSTTLTVDKLPVIRVGDTYIMPPPRPPATALGGSLTVSLDKGLPVHRAGDRLSDGSVSGIGSLTVRAG